MEYIDLEDDSTWSAEMSRLVADASVTVACWGVGEDAVAGELVSRDHDYSEGLEADLRAAIAGKRVLAYHASCLLPHELEGIRNRGMQLLSRSLIEEKLSSARHHYPDLIDDETVALLGKSARASFNRGTRNGLISMVMPILAFDESPGEFHHYLEDWGGEAISATGDTTKDDRQCADAISRLSERSTPTIIGFGVRPEDLRRYTRLWPCLVGLRLGIRELSITATTATSIAAEHVLSFIHPGSVRWPEGQPVRRRPLDGA